KPKRRQGKWEFSHPHVQWLEDDEEQPASSLLLTRYRLTEGLKVADLRRLIRNACDAVLDQLADPLPEALRNRLKLPGLPQAFQAVHQPTSAEQYHEGRRRILFDDLFEF